jgi:hypothetical protein
MHLRSRLHNDFPGVGWQSLVLQILSGGRCFLHCVSAICARRKG